MSKTSSTTARRSRLKQLSRAEWREVFTVWSEVEAGGKFSFAVVLLAIFAANRLESRIGLAAAWAFAFALVYGFGCFARWRHFRARQPPGEKEPSS